MALSKIVQIVPATPGWWIEYSASETAAVHAEPFVAPVACWGLFTDEEARFSFMAAIDGHDARDGGGFLPPWEEAANYKRTFYDPQLEFTPFQSDDGCDHA